MNPNSQTPGPLNAVSLDREPRIYAPIPSRGNYAVADVHVNDWDQQNPIISRDQAEANARLLAASFNAFDKAGRTLGVDAAELAERVDLAALIHAARHALAYLDTQPNATPGSIAEVGQCGARYLLRTELAKLSV